MAAPNTFKLPEFTVEPQRKIADKKENPFRALKEVSKALKLLLKDLTKKAEVRKLSPAQAAQLIRVSELLISMRYGTSAIPQPVLMVREIERKRKRDIKIDNQLKDISLIIEGRDKQ